MKNKITKETSRIFLSDDSIITLNNYITNGVNLLELIEELNIKTYSRPPAISFSGDFGGYVYEIKNNITNKKYIGRTINPIRRLLEHSFSSSNDELKNDLVKYGLINFNMICYKSDDYIKEEKEIIKRSTNLYNRK